MEEGWQGRVTFMICIENKLQSPIPLSQLFLPVPRTKYPTDHQYLHPNCPFLSFIAWVHVLLVSRESDFHTYFTLHAGNWELGCNVGETTQKWILSPMIPWAQPGHPLIYFSPIWFLWNKAKRALCEAIWFVLTFSPHSACLHRTDWHYHILIVVLFDFIKI